MIREIGVNFLLQLRDVNLTLYKKLKLNMSIITQFLKTNSQEQQSLECELTLTKSNLKIHQRLMGHLEPKQKEEILIFMAIH